MRKNNTDSVDDEQYNMTGGNRGDYSSVIMLSLILGLSVLFLLLLGCTTRYYPQPGDRITIVDNYAILEKDGFAFAITPRFWTRDPQNISDFFTTFHVVIRNTSDKPISILPGDIYLLDEEMNQYETLTAAEVADIIFYDDFMRDKFRPFPDRFEPVTGDRLTARANLWQDAFHYGEIFPGARKSGYIFFRRLRARNVRSTILFRGEEIIFIRS